MIIEFRSGSMWMASATLLLAGMLLMSGCANQAPAPVTERSTAVAIPAAPVVATDTPAPAAEAKAAPAPGIGTYTVKKGDTLFSIALENGQSYRDIATWNNLEDPNRIQIGQQLRVKPPGADAGAPVAVAKPIALPAPLETRPLGAGSNTNTDSLKREPRGGKLPYSEEALARLQRADSPSAAEAKAEARPAPVEKPVDKPSPQAVAEETVDWAWPANGKVIASFVDGSNKGLDIAANTGEPVLAAAAGKVILVSSALRGYGNFVIVKHTTAFLSVYAHNSRVLVKEEQQVSKGQKIAEIGSSDSDQPKLHFEIRHQGKPVDPLKFLPSR